MLNVFKMRSTLVRMESEGRRQSGQGQIAFTKGTSAARAGRRHDQHLLPPERVGADGVLGRGEFPARRQSAARRVETAGTRPAAETEQAFADFEQFVQFIKAQAGVRFVTATELMTLYADRALTRASAGPTCSGWHDPCRRRFDFVRNPTVCPVGGGRVRAPHRRGGGLDRPQDARRDGRLMPLDGPRAVRSIHRQGHCDRRASAGPPSVARFATQPLLPTAHRRMPDEIWIGAENIPPVDYLATLGSSGRTVFTSGKPPASVDRKSARITVDRIRRG